MYGLEPCNDSTTLCYIMTAHHPIALTRILYTAPAHVMNFLGAASHARLLLQELPALRRPIASIVPSASLFTAHVCDGVHLLHEILWQTEWRAA